MEQVLFICTGNYYRSRFAEIYFNHRAQIEGLHWAAISRGFDAANPGNVGQISKYAVERLDKEGIQLPENLSYPIRIDVEDLITARKIIALNQTEHQPFVLQMFPGWLDKFIYWDIYDIQDETPETALMILTEKVEKLLIELKNS